VAQMISEFLARGHQQGGEPPLHAFTSALTFEL